MRIGRAGNVRIDLRVRERADIVERRVRQATNVGIGEINVATLEKANIVKRVGLFDNRQSAGHQCAAFIDASGRCRVVDAARLFNVNAFDGASVAVGNFKRHESGFLHL